MLRDLTSGRRFRGAFIASAGLLLGIFSHSSLVQGQDSPPEIAEARVGFGGRLKAGAWTPVAVTVTGMPASGAEVVAIAPDYDGNLLETTLSASVAAASNSKFSGLIQLGRLDGAVRVEVRSEGHSLASVGLSVTAPESLRTEVFRHETLFWGILGTKAPFDQAAAALPTRMTGRGQTPAAVAIPLDWSELPDDPDGWESLDVIVVAGKELAMTEEQNRLLQKWTSRGGRLIVTLGSATETFQASPLAKWAPVTVKGVRNVTQLESVAALVPRSASLVVSRLDPDVTAAVMAGPQAALLGGPVIARGYYGAGTVTAFAFSLDDRPISEWSDLPSLCGLLANWGAGSAPRSQDHAELASNGVNDLATQLISGLDRFEDMHRPSFQAVMVWTAVWLLVLGPLDYLIVHRLLRKPHATWLTMPVWVAVAALAAVRSAEAANNHPLAVNEIDLLDVEPATQTVRGRSWMTLYSPETARYEIAAVSGLTGNAAQLGWMAKPDEGLRGLYRKGSGASFGSPTFRSDSDRGKLTGLPVRVWSSYGLAAEWETEFADETPWIVADLHDSGAGRLRGTIRHNFQEPLSDWIVVYNRFVFSPVIGAGELLVDDLAPGAEWRPERGKQLLIKTFLTGSQDRLAKGVDSISMKQQDYDPLDADPRRLLRMLVFHEAAGGPGFTGLTNDPLGTLDLSRLVNPDASLLKYPAVLLARTRSVVTKLQIDGKEVKPENRWTFIRAVLPVDQEKQDTYRGGK